ncbi:hypothetical protein IAQ61_002287 [Plenodomus lingam]|uniref:uncharacterized protein n=1 Tax=Leptosphaeria maculans TaxID=5022 RepID=UPI00331D6632|nr:hypothetical protein IAQ61_002287 [Plenodomus lingam]
MLESAIPEHLRRERKCPMKKPPNYVPPFSAYCARFPITMDSLVMATIGAQYETAAKNDGKGIATIKAFLTNAPEAVRPSFWQVTSMTDKRGAYNIAVIAYWRAVEVHEQWETQSGFRPWWQSPERENEAHGWFQEILRPTVDRFETNFSNPAYVEGAANLQEHMSGKVREHGYWGSVRDRMAAAQDDELKCESGPRPADKSTNGSSSNEKSASRVHVEGMKNLCVIRSGQDWSDTLPEERKLYLETMQPVLVTGMKYLRDEGKEDGCYAMNLWDVVDSETYKADRERTFGLGYFEDLASLEKWSKSHPTHINIFTGFLRYAKKLNDNPSLRLFHEVYSLEEDQQLFEYVGCHEESGLRNALSAS